MINQKSLIIFFKRQNSSYYWTSYNKLLPIIRLECMDSLSRQGSTDWNKCFTWCRYPPEFESPTPRSTPKFTKSPTKENWGQRNVNQVGSPKRRRLVSQAATQSGGVDGNLKRSALAVELWSDKQRREVKVGASFWLNFCHAHSKRWFMWFGPAKLFPGPTTKGSLE